MTPVKDKEDKLRYLLNFAGMRSVSYWNGIFLADIIIYTIPVACLIIFTFVLGIKKLNESAGSMFLTFFFFGLPFLNTIYICSFIFYNSEKAFKYGLLILLGVTGIEFLLSAIFASFSNETALWLIDMIVHTNPIVSAACSLIIVLGADIGYNLGTLWGCLVIEAIVIHVFVIIIDMWLMSRFKGLNAQQQTVERPQMDENQDVLNHKALANDLWNNGN